MANSQQFLSIESVDRDFIFLKDGSVSLLLSVSAVNFALLFETEQISIIDSFAGLINSLSFPIQIIIYSKVLDVSSYLLTIDKAMAKQTNPLLEKMALGYRDFVEKSIKDNNVLDKQFYICIKVTPIEIGFLPTNHDEKIRKVETILAPRRDHLIRQLNRLGLKVKQMVSKDIVKLFYDIYNPPETKPLPLPLPEITIPTQIPPKLRPIKNSLNQPLIQTPQPAVPPTSPLPPIPQPQAPISAPLPPQNNQPLSQAQLSSPFVVEELPDE